MSRIDNEQRIVATMISYYCRRKHNTPDHTLCPQCSALLAYSQSRLRHCRFADHKTSCRKCSVHCYSPSMREQIRKVMRYSAPRMLLINPVEALRHLLR